MKSRNEKWIGRGSLNRTVQHAADTARAGSTVYVRGGIYEEVGSVKASGNARTGFEIGKNLYAPSLEGLRIKFAEYRIAARRKRGAG
jgi:hypothetical protein